jgi:hypothetical protein
MTSITESAFDSDAAYLRIWFNDGVTGSQLLSPDRQLVGVPYAYRASVADSAVAVDSIPSGSVGANEVDSSQIQLRGNMACANTNSFIYAIDENGDATCATDNGSSYNAGSGIAIDIKNIISIANNGVTTAKLQNNSVTDAKIADMSWGKLSGIPAGFADGVDNDTNTAYSAGSGIAINGSNQISVDSVPWGVLTDIPADLANGDDDTTYSANISGGLSLSGTEFSLADGGVTSRKMHPTYLVEFNRSANSLTIFHRNIEPTNPLGPRAYTRICMSDSYTPPTNQVAFIGGTVSINATSGYVF